ncbi:hypothetical protein [Puniceibacterium sediminis]|uniref:hypothetical protein n=1 Tax=Puniceibacterium sediminis TaxID=1608407 RepID=UPI001594EFAE|nr:hypothetical protein [Puniceibacterium sediminis]
MAFEEHEDGTNAILLDSAAANLPALDHALGPHADAEDIFITGDLSDGGETGPPTSV